MDEMYHALGAKYILTEGKPVFPTGDIYSRAMGYTYLVALSYKIFGVSEFAGRFPSFLFLILLLVTSGYFVRRLFGTFPALLFLLAMGLSPISIELARFCRMYTLLPFFIISPYGLYFLALNAIHKQITVASGLNPFFILKSNTVLT